MSFVGESAAIELMAPYGHQFEFDGYGAGSREMFKDTFLKQKRTPDLVCQLCSQKMEVRAKKRLMISMSDSSKRPFDQELHQDVWVGFVRVVLHPSINGRNPDPLDPASYRPPTNIYVTTVAELSRTRPLAVRSKPKPDSKGNETYLVWPTLSAPCTGVLQGVERDEITRIHFTNQIGTDVTCVPPQQSFPYNGIRKGQAVIKNETLICGVARTLSKSQLECKAVGAKAEATQD
jgi:hypothetical protein